MRVWPGCLALYMPAQLADHGERRCPVPGQIQYRLRMMSVKVRGWAGPGRDGRRLRRGCLIGRSSRQVPGFDISLCHSSDSEIGERETRSGRAYGVLAGAFSTRGTVYGP
jgi:hypothetical protein